MVQKKHELIKLVSPNISKEDINRIYKVLDSENLVEGKYVDIFEDKLSKFTHIDNVTLVSNATAGLHLAVKALDITKDDYVIVPSFTFPATANVVEIIGANVIFCDVNLETYVVDSVSIENTISVNKDKNIKAIIIVHEFGYPANSKEISEIARKNNLKFIEDSACALGTISNGHHVGYYSDICVFSFHPRKAITSGEGGAVISKNKELINRVKILKNHGIVKKDGYMDFIEAGLNYRMTDFQAAMLIGQLDRFLLELEKRRDLVKIYCELLSKNEFIALPKIETGHSWQSFMIVLDQKIDRKILIEYLLENNIQSNFGAQCLPMLNYYKNKYNLNDEDYKVSKILFKHGLVLPLYGKLNINDIEIICSYLLNFLNK